MLELPLVSLGSTLLYFLPFFVSNAEVSSSAVVLEVQ